MSLSIQYILRIHSHTGIYFVITLYMIYIFPYSILCYSTSITIVYTMLYDGLLERGQATYQQCCNDFGYSETNAPRRVLTKLSKGRGVGFMDVRRSCMFCVDV